MPTIGAKDGKLTKRADFLRLSKRGRSWANSLLVMKAMPNSLSSSRLGFSVSKALGNAVSRNRIKRQIREAARQLSIKPGWDVLIIARQAAAGATFSEIVEAIRQLLEQGRLAGHRE